MRFRRSARFVPPAVAVLVFVIGIAPGTVSASDPEVVDDFARSVTYGLGTSQINDLEWDSTATGSFQPNVDGDEAHWALNGSGNFLADTAKLDLDEDGPPTLPFEVLAEVRVDQASQATQLHNTFSMFMFLAEQPWSNGTYQEWIDRVGGTAVSLRQDQSGGMTLGTFDDRWLETSGGTTDDLLPGFWEDIKFFVRMRVTELGTYGKVWFVGDTEPTTWQAWDDGTSQTSANFRWFGISFARLGAAGPQTDVYIDSLDILEGYVPPVRPAKVIFVHGIGASAEFVEFDDLLAWLGDELGEANVINFVHHQDAAFDQDGTCIDVPAHIPPAQPNGGMPVDLDADSTSTDKCDSQGDLGLNAIKLHADVQAAYSESGNRPVVLIANSMGAAIARGMLTYSMELGDGVATEMVDSVVFLQGAHDGAYVASLADDGWALPPPLSGIAGPIISEYLLGRPAIADLAPGSEWYQWANDSDPGLPDIPYFNVYGDIELVLENCAPFFGCFELGRLGIGDGGLMTGTDDPYDTPASGGARFAASAPDDRNWQWRLHDPIRASTAIDFASDVLGSPVQHGNFGKPGRMSEISVADCMYQDQTSITYALISVVRNRMTGDPACAS